MTSPRSIDTVERICLGGTEQWIRIRGHDTSHPVVLLIQQGPGLPMINEAADSYKRWRLEDDFVVVYWDQRACGKSFSRAISPQSMTIDRLIADTHELIQALVQRFDAPAIYVVGFSFGGTIAALTAARHPERIRALATVGLDVQFDQAERVAYAFALDQAAERRHKRALHALRRIGPPPHLTSRSFNTQARWVTTFGGVNRQETYTSLLLTTLRQLIVSRNYTPREIIGTLRGMGFTLDHLLPQMAGLDLGVTLRHLDIPMFMLQGRHDYVAPPAIAEQYYHTLEAPQGKELIWFDQSAHMPQYEEPGKFRASVLRMKERCERVSIELAPQPVAIPDR